MAWNEVANLRTLIAKTWRDSENPTRYVCHHILGTGLHYPTAGPDSDVLDGEVNFAFQHVTAGGRDLYRTIVAGWHYALGRDITGVFADIDGTVGFGGRQGQHWLKLRLAKVGYLHWPTRDWQDVGGAPSYVRARLSQATDVLSIGPEGAESTINISSKATWERIWSTPGGGQLDISWLVEGKQLKEEIIINASAREWIAANRPPSTPADETWFGFVFRLDVSDIPRWVINELLQDINGDFSDDDGNIEIRDALGRLLGFMPVSHAYSDLYQVGVGDEGDPIYERDTVRLRKRIWRDGDGNHYFLIGARVNHLNAMHAGAITFDPDFVIQADVGGKDTYVNSLNADKHYGGETAWYTYNAQYWGLIEFDLSSIPGDATCDSAVMHLWNQFTSGTDKTCTLHVILAANVDWPIGASSDPGTGKCTYAHHTEDTQEWAGGENGCSVSGTDRAADTIGVVTYLANDGTDTDCTGVLTAATVETWFGDPNSNYGMVGFGNTSDKPKWRSSNYATAGYRPKLVVEYTEAAAGQPFILRTFGIPTGAGARNRPGGWN